MKSIIDAKGWIDITMSLQNGMVNWPGDPSFKIEKIAAIENGDEINISKISTCTHIGTHVDAPLHYFENGIDVTSIPLENLIGAAKIILIESTTEISVDEIKKHDIIKGDRILFKTKHSDDDWSLKPFDEKFIALTTDAAEYLKQKEILLVGIDYLSISGMNNSKQVHQLFLSSGICILEGLNLQNIAAGSYEFICLPLKIKDAEGAPARVIIRRIL